MSAVETLKAYRTIHNADNVDDAIAEIQRCYERIDELGGEIDRLRDCLRMAGADIFNLNDEIDRLRAEAEHHLKAYQTLFNRETAAMAEIDRLRTEVARLNAELDWHVEEIKRIKEGDADAELDRLRAEFDHQRIQLTAKQDAFVRENGRLRAEKAEANNQWRLDYNACAIELDRLRADVVMLRDALRKFVNYGLYRDEANLILAKTAKEGK